MKNNNKTIYFNAIFPHYREEQWDLMLGDNQLDFKIYCSSDSLFGIKSVFHKYSIKYPEKLLKLKNYIIFKRIIIWQTKTISISIFGNYNNFIFLGEMNIISTWISAIIARLRNRKVYFWTHGLYGNESKLKYFFRILFYKICNEIIVYEKHSKELLKKNFFLKSKKIHIIYNSLNFTLQDAIFNDINQLKKNNLFGNLFKNKLPTILFVGRLNKNKKISLAIKAIKIINSEKERLNFLIIGDGPELDVINKEIINHENIKRTQSIYDEFVLSKYLYFSDLLISPGNVGLNAIHSLTYGTPVCTHNDIAYQMPEFQALNENNAIFFKKDDVNSLVNSLDNWLNHNENFTDKNLVRRTIIERYNPKNQKHILKKILFKE